jgi:hypothetical protein
MIDMCMGNNNLFERKPMGRKSRQNGGHIFSGINHDRFARRLVAKDGAVAAKYPDRESLNNHFHCHREGSTELT